MLSAVPWTLNSTFKFVATNSVPDGGIGGSGGIGMPLLPSEPARLASAAAAAGSGAVVAFGTNKSS